MGKSGQKALSITLKAILIIVICCLIGKSTGVMNTIIALPYAKIVSLLLGGFSKLSSTIKDTILFTESKEYVIYSDMLKTLLSGIVCWIFQLTIFQILFNWIWPVDNTKEYAGTKRGIKTGIRYFITGLFATFLSGKIYGILFEGETKIELMGVELLAVSEPLLPGLSLYDVRNAQMGHYSGRLIILAVLYLVLFAAIALIRAVVDKHSGKTFLLFSIGSRSFFKVGFIGFSIYLFMKDVATNLINSFTIMMLYTCFATPTTASISGTIILVACGMGIMLFCN